MEIKYILALFAVFGCGLAVAEVDLPKYKLCVSHLIFDACQKLTANPRGFAEIECISARDRMECLAMVNRREADFLAVDPEDMYVALHMANEDFSVFSEIRTREESDAQFRYDGIMLVHKNSAIRSLADLQGKKSCHTGYGRNVGYKIPITKLNKHQILKIGQNPAVSFVEKELMGLTELFSQSCLVGKWSPNEEVNRALKKRYSNLCALCENPEKCDYPDKYSGYDGSIRCLAENGGDVAFTKVIYVKRHFGLSVGGNPPKTTAQGNAEDFEYLCEDGSRKPITGPSCTWAQRPWQAYMGNADINTKLTPLQQKINAFYTAGQQDSDKASAAKMWINDANVVVDKLQQTLPGQHLTNAQYKDVIERDGHMQQKIRLCTNNEVEQRKCEILKQAAFSRDIRPEFECVMIADCIQAVQEDKADATVVTPKDQHRAHSNRMQSVVHEELDAKNVYCALVDRDIDDSVLAKSSISFDESNPRSVDVALFINHKREFQKCPTDLVNSKSGQIRVLRADDLTNHADLSNKQLLCPDLKRHDVSDIANCHFNNHLSTGVVFTRSDLRQTQLEAMQHGFTALSDKFGHGAKTEDVFELFGQFETGAKNVIFGDDSARLVSQSNRVTGNNEDVYNQIHCVKQ